jgi:hypothetical protein
MEVKKMIEKMKKMFEEEEAMLSFCLTCCGGTLGGIIGAFNNVIVSLIAA